MPYVKTIWEDGQSEPVDEDNLNKIETALKTSFDHTEEGATGAHSIPAYVSGAVGDHNTATSVHGATDIGKELLRLITPSGVSVPAFTATGSVTLIEGISTSVVVTVSGGSSTLTFEHGILTGIA